jgi:hypothetical protein
MTGKLFTAFDEMRVIHALPGGLLILGLLLSAGCSSQLRTMEPAAAAAANSPANGTRAQQKYETAQSAMPANVVPLSENGASENIALRILGLDAQVKPVTDQMYRTLNEVIDDACASIGKLRRKQDARWDRQYAAAVLKCIDTTLISHGFLYPDVGGVDQLADGLMPFQMSVARKKTFEAHVHNRRRASMISQRFPGPFYVLDCDTASFIYLGVADQLKLPLHLVSIPAYNRRRGHAFVRWREGSHFIDWETTDGVVRTDDSYINAWKINSAEINAHSALTDLSSDQTMGCEHYLRAIQFERSRDFEQALRELSVALDLYPQSLDARIEFAWDTATGPGVRVRKNTDAIADALFVLHLVDDPDARDTLAAAYASAGLFDLAVKEEKSAIVDGARSSASGLAYKRRLILYEQHTAYRQSEPAHEPAGGFK